MICWHIYASEFIQGHRLLFIPLVDPNKPFFKTLNARRLDHGCNHLTASARISSADYIFRLKLCSLELIISSIRQALFESNGDASFSIGRSKLVSEFIK